MSWGLGCGFVATENKNVDGVGGGRDAELAANMLVLSRGVLALLVRVRDLEGAVAALERRVGGAG